MIKKVKSKKGFTLVELIVVIAIIAILATVSVVGYTQFVDQAEQAKADAEFKTLMDSARTYAINGDDIAIDQDTPLDPDYATINFDTQSEKFVITEFGLGTEITEDEILRGYFEAILGEDMSFEFTDDSFQLSGLVITYTSSNGRLAQLSFNLA